MLLFRAFAGLVFVVAGLVSLGCRQSARAGGEPTATGQTSAPPAAPGREPGDFVQVVAGKDNTCARTKGGKIACWGDNAFTTTSLSASQVPPGLRSKPMIVSGIESAVDLALASTTGCGVQADGKLLCWADYTAQMLRPSVPGSGGDGPRPEPLIARFPLVTDAKSVTASRASYATFCVLTRTHEVTCLQSERDSVPADPKTLQLPDDVEVIAPSDTHVCALRKGGKLGCWKGEPTGFEVLLEGVQMLSAGSAYNCVVDGSNDVLCWGSNSLGQSGRGSASPTSSIDSPTRVDGLPKIARVRAGIHHTCAVAQTGSVHCWGDNRFGQLGSPHGAVQNVRNAEDVALGEWHSCALIRGGAIRCWGRNHRGQLGDGTNVERAEAKPVTAVVPP